MLFDLIVAADEGWGIAKGNDLPWSKTDVGRADMRYFRTVTMDGAVIMGRKTWDSLPKKPLPGRVNIVISRGPGPLEPGASVESGAIFVNDLDTALDVARRCPACFVIGGREIYTLALHHPYLRGAYVSRIQGRYECDTYFPSHLLPARALIICEMPGITFYKYDFTNHEETKFLDLLREIMGAPTRPSRTGINTRSVFNRCIRFNLTDARGPVLPLLTTKSVNWKSVYYELIWFLQGSTNTKYLDENGVKIWAGNSSREYLDSRGLKDYEVGDVGPIYGAQWRNWNGVDQLAQVIDTIKKDPWDRRMIVSAWNVSDIPKMCLPPCHYSFQFYVDGKRLNCLVNMRSADVALGVPFNIASYAFLTHIVAFLTGLIAGELSINMADCHIYENHLAEVGGWITRAPVRFPIIRFGPRITELTGPAGPTIDDFAKKFTFSDYEIEGYKSRPFIKLQMAV